MSTAHEVVDNRFEAIETLKVPFEAYLSEIQAVTVETAEQYEAAAFGLKKLKTWQKDITDYFEPERARTEAYKAVTSTKKAYLDKAVAVENVIKGKMVSFQQAEQKRIRESAIAAAEAEAAARRELAEQAPTPEHPEAVSTVVIPPVPEATKVAGISVRMGWTFIITNPDLVNRSFLTVDEAKVRKIVSTMGKDAEKLVGGITVVEDIGIGARRG